MAQREIAAWRPNPTEVARAAFEDGWDAGVAAERARLVAWAVAWLQALAETEHSGSRSAALLGAADQFESDLILHEAADRLPEIPA